MKITRKELGEHINTALIDLTKKYDYKKRNNVLYKKYDDYFITILISATGINNDLINVRGNVKPYFMDDVFWEVFQMPENSKSPIGLRANGAFAVKGLQIYNQNKKIANYSEVERGAEELLKECDAEIKRLISKMGSNFKIFIEYSKSLDKQGMYKPALAEMLLNIKEEKYLAAKKLATYEMENQRYGNIENQGKDIYRHVVDFCEDRLEG